MISFAKENEMIAMFENKDIVSVKDLKQATHEILNFLDINHFTAYYMFRIALSQCISNRLIETTEFKRFLIKILQRMLETIPFEHVMLIIISLNEYEQVVIGHLFINPYNENNVVYQLIKLAVKAKRFEFEIQLLEYIKKYYKRICKTIFDINIFLENLIPIHTIYKKKMYQEEKEVFYVMLGMTKQVKLRKKIITLVNSLDNNTN